MKPFFSRIAVDWHIEIEAIRKRMLVFYSSFLLDLKLTLLECQGQRFHCCSNLPVQDCQEIRESQGILFQSGSIRRKRKVVAFH